jgi:hypothetical protein
MKDIIDKILAYLPHYFADFGWLFSAPKNFIAARDVNSDETFAASLLFLAISLVISTLMITPLAPTGKDLWTTLTATAVENMIAVSLGALAIYIAWWLVGGRARVRGFFTTYAYFSGVSVVLFAGVSIVSTGVLKVFDPESMSVPAGSWKDFSSHMEQISVVGWSAAVQVAGYIFLAALFFWFIWSIIAWGAFRELNGLSKMRSFFAFLFWSVFWFVIASIETLVGFALQ